MNLNKRFEYLMLPTARRMNFISSCALTWFNCVRNVDKHVVTVVLWARHSLIDNHVRIQRFTSNYLTRKINSKCDEKSETNVPIK